MPDKREILDLVLDHNPDVEVKVGPERALSLGFDLMAGGPEAFPEGSSASREPLGWGLSRGRSRRLCRFLARDEHRNGTERSAFSHS